MTPWSGRLAAATTTQRKWYWRRPSTLQHRWDLKLPRSSWYTTNQAWSDSYSCEWFIKLDHELNESWKLNTSYNYSYNGSTTEGSSLRLRGRNYQYRLLLVGAAMPPCGAKQSGVRYQLVGVLRCIRASARVADWWPITKRSPVAGVQPRVCEIRAG